MSNPFNCEACGTGLIDRCLRCGAPQCCPKCCVTAVVTPRPFYIITWDGQTHSNFTVVYNDEDKAVQS